MVMLGPLVGVELQLAGQADTIALVVRSTHSQRASTASTTSSGRSRHQSLIAVGAR
jgi:hypothetical protein